MESITQERVPLNSIVGTVQQSLGQLFRTSHPQVVFGEPIEFGETKIIPCTEVTVNMGFGGGGGTDLTSDAQSEGATKSVNPDGKQSPAAGHGGGMGIGGGGSTRSRPVAIIVVTPGGVSVQPIIDVTKVILTAITTGGMALLTMRFLIRALIRKR
jgi:uncharacterized spore protein YtfJ